MDEVILHALARGKPVAAKRVQALVDENARLQQWMSEYGHPLLDELERAQNKIQLAQVVINQARKWAAHDDALSAAIKAYFEVPL